MAKANLRFTRNGNGDTVVTGKTRKHQHYTMGNQGYNPKTARLGGD